MPIHMETKAIITDEKMVRILFCENYNLTYIFD